MCYCEGQTFHPLTLTSVVTISLSLALDMPCPRRPFINPNDGFFEVLLDYAEELEREQTTRLFQKTTRLFQI